MLPSEQELYRERYHAELDRRSSTNDRIDSMVNLFALLVGVMLFLISYADIEILWCRWLYWAALISAMGFLVGAAAVIYSIFMSDQALYISDPKDYREYHKQMLFAHQGRVDFVDQLIADEIAEDYLKASQFNALRNALRERAMRRAKVLFSVALLAMIWRRFRYRWIIYGSVH